MLIIASHSYLKRCVNTRVGPAATLNLAHSAMRLQKPDTIATSPVPNDSSLWVVLVGLVS